MMEILWSFLLGGGICGIAQLCMELTPFRVSTAHVLVGVVILGELLCFFGWYQPLAEACGMGAIVPLCGFGNTMMRGVLDAMEQDGLIGILSGGFAASAVGLTMAITAGFFAALFGEPRG